MADAAALPILIVEGSDDQHVVTQLLMRHNIVAHAVVSGRDQPPNTQLLIESAGGKQPLLSLIEVRLISPTAPVGFVLDADDPSKQTGNLVATWASVRSHLTNQNVITAEDLDTNGLVCPVRGLLDEQQRLLHAGVWIMPDNSSDGMLEDFLKELMDEGDTLLPFADQATRDAKAAHGATFEDKDLKKAILSAWLAWQDPPGLPYGTALGRQRFRHDAELAVRFVDWVKCLTGIS